MPDKNFFPVLTPQEPNGKEVSSEEAEKILLEKLAIHERLVERTILDLACLNSNIGRPEKAAHYINRLMTSTDDPEKKAFYLLAMGCSMEKMRKYEEAIIYYSQGLLLEPSNSETWYFINNNLGFCLNYFNKYVEAEPYCRAAIKINPHHHNAYKNLGISMEGQDKYPEAAVLYIKAVETNARDSRALVLLEELFEKHEAIKYDFPDIHAEIEKCREAVRLANRTQPDMNNN